MTDEPERPEAFINQLRPVVDFMRQQYWHVYDPAERKRMLTALTAFEQAEPQPPSTSDNG